LPKSGHWFADLQVQEMTVDVVSFLRVGMFHAFFKLPMV
jgi:hypothetical protein